MATNPARDPTPGVHLSGPMQPGYETILTPAALEFIVDLTRCFATASSLLAARVARQRRLRRLVDADVGQRRDFETFITLPAYRAIH